MKGAALYLFFFLIPLYCLAQQVQTLVPKGPVVIGTAFQVQYIITEPSGFVASTTPAFENFRLVSGPNYYKGNAVVNGRSQPIHNIAFTLVPLKEGVLQIEGLKATFANGSEIAATPGTVSVGPQPKASFTARSSYTDASLYMPASKADLKTLVAKNLFIRVDLDRRSCYEGEPVVATYKLYSRLQSVSEAQKSPAFYGFSIIDMADIRQAHLGVETIDGKVFNTSVLRKVQLYPIRSGSLGIDEMYVHNEVTFDDTITHTEVMTENDLVTPRLEVNVKPLPPGKPQNFSGAVGAFSITASLQKGTIRGNEPGKLILTVRGRGNFIQFGQPIVSWPSGIDAFEPQVTETLNKEALPVEGERRYEFGFAADTAGTYSIPPVSFSWFDPRSKTYKTAASDSLVLKVTPAAKQGTTRKKEGTSFSFLPFLLFFLLGIAAFFFRRKKKAPAQEKTVEIKKTDYAGQLEAIEPEKLTGKEVCLQVQRILTQYQKERGPLTSSGQEAMRNLFADCQVLLYTDADAEEGKKELLLRAREIIGAR